MKNVPYGPISRSVAACMVANAFSIYPVLRLSLFPNAWIISFFLPVMAAVKWTVGALLEQLIIMSIFYPAVSYFGHVLVTDLTDKPWAVGTIVGLCVFTMHLIYSYLPIFRLSLMLASADFAISLCYNPSPWLHSSTLFASLILSPVIMLIIYLIGPVMAYRNLIIEASGFLDSIRIYIESLVSLFLVSNISTDNTTLEQVKGFLIRAKELEHFASIETGMLGIRLPLTPSKLLASLDDMFHSLPACTASSFATPENLPLLMESASKLLDSLRQLLNEDIQIDQILAPLEQLRHVLGEFDRDLSQTKLNKGIPPSSPDFAHFAFLFGFRELIKIIISTGDAIISHNYRRHWGIPSPFIRSLPTYHHAAKAFIESHRPAFVINNSPLPLHFHRRLEMTASWLVIFITTPAFRFSLKGGCIAGILTGLMLSYSYNSTERLSFMWICVTVLVLHVGPTIGQLYARAKLRLLGTLIGGVVSCLGCVVATYSSGLWLWLILSLYLFPCFYIAHSTVHSYACGISLLTIALALLSNYDLLIGNGMSIGHLAKFLGVRVGCVAAGIVLSLLVNSLIWPHRAHIEVRRAGAWMMLQLCRTYSSLCSIPVQVEDLHHVLLDITITENTENNEPNVTEINDHVQSMMRKIQEYRRDERIMARHLKSLRSFAMYCTEEPTLETTLPLTCVYQLLDSFEHILEKLRWLRIGVTQELRLTTSNHDDIFKLWIPGLRARKKCVSSCVSLFYLLFATLYAHMPLPILVPDIESTYQDLIKTTHESMYEVDVIAFMYFSVYAEANRCIIKEAGNIRHILAEVLGEVNEMGSRYMSINDDMDEQENFLPLVTTTPL
eukprot:NODE_472_length_2715_cov_48.271991_g404_i0.p1 GENE.NODE_472_length_2715_cov_48.271991_g404_i0~~NODE_472_length_2715_cov_48.271991_g404_i0.p1  ORF type:complete len:839 (+),score=120.77 NODE_472_length_2715_cov_48.271991_g404_i0:67-2583(+)